MTSRLWRVLLLIAVLAAVGFVPSVVRFVAMQSLLADEPQNAKVSTTIYEKEIVPFLKKHCFACHGNGKAKADFSFDKFKDDKSVYEDRKSWDSVQHMLEMREMPPEGRPKPDHAEIDLALKSIRGLFHEFDRTAKPNVGRVTIRRLNRTEYNNTIRDLVGVDFKPAEDFPADDVGYGFDNIGDVLSVSPLLLEKYLNAAETILEQSIVIVDVPKSAKQKFATFRTSSLNTAGELGKVISFEEGDYHIRCQVAADQAGDEPVRVQLRVAGKDVKDIEINEKSAKPSVLEATVRMKAGTTRVAIALLNPSTSDSPKPRTLYLKSLEVEGPFNPPAVTLPESHKKLMTHKDGLSPRDAAREIVTRFATRAFRRPVLTTEVDRCLTLFDASQKQGQRFEMCVRAALYRVMVSPYFLFRVELDPPGTLPGTPYMIGEYELASRLSYFLWNSMPDDELFALAGKGELRKNLPYQIVRMTKDPKSKSFLESFAEQWLTLRKFGFGVTRSQAVSGLQPEFAASDDSRESVVFRIAGSGKSQHFRSARCRLYLCQ